MIAETERLVISKFTEADAGFIYRLMNSPGWLEFIGDRNITEETIALEYLKNGALKSYEDFGFGGWLLTKKSSGEKIGSAGIYKRDFLEYPDLGYALLREYEGQGFISEAIAKIMDLAGETFKIPVLSAITDTRNVRSVALLKKFGFDQTGEINWPGTEEVLLLFCKELATKEAQNAEEY